MQILAQAAPAADSCLMGAVVVPFPIVSVAVGLVISAVLVYFARRLS